MSNNSLCYPPIGVDDLLEFENGERFPTLLLDMQRIGDNDSVRPSEIRDVLLSMDLSKADA